MPNINPRHTHEKGRATTPWWRGFIIFSIKQPAKTFFCIFLFKTNRKYLSKKITKPLTLHKQKYG